MKRLTAFVMIILMCFALVACGGQTSADQPAENSTETTQMQQTSDAPQAQPTSSVPQAPAVVVAAPSDLTVYLYQTIPNCSASPVTVTATVTPEVAVPM